MTKKPNMVTVSFMLLITIFLALFAFYMPEYFGELKTLFYVLALISGVKTIRMTTK